MPFIMYKGERKVADLIGRAYRTELSPADAKRAEAALLAANPALANLSNVKEGALLTIPDIPGVAAGSSDAPSVLHVALAAGREDVESHASPAQDGAEPQ